MKNKKQKKWETIVVSVYCRTKKEYADLIDHLCGEKHLPRQVDFEISPKNHKK